MSSSGLCLSRGGGDRFAGRPGLQPGQEVGRLRLVLSFRGSARIRGVVSAHRSAVAPHVPSCSESGRTMAPSSHKAKLLPPLADVVVQLGLPCCSLAPVGELSFSAIFYII